MRIASALTFISLASVFATATHTLAQTTGFTYQGKLSQDGTPANGTFDLRFALYNAATAGAATTQTFCADNVAVVDGLFAVEIPLTRPTTGLDAFLDIQVRADASPDCSVLTGYTALLPRPRLAPAPAAVFASVVPATSPLIPGAIRFNASQRQFEGYDGIFWYPFALATSPVLPSFVQNFAAPGIFNFTVPAGVTRLGIDVFGAGGGGSSRSPGVVEGSTCTVGQGGFATGGSGGASGAAGRFVIDVTPGELLTVHVHVGVGGAGNGSGAGGTGNPSRVRRNGNTDEIVVALGGGGGGYRPTSATMGTYSGSNCNGAVGGSGGAGPGAATLSASGTTVSSFTGGGGGIGFGPSCRVDFPNNSVFCPAFPGNGGGARSVGEAANFITTAGAGGAGGTLAANGQPGSIGRVYLWWN